MRDNEFSTISVAVLDGGGTPAKPVCDICGEPGGGAIITSDDLRHAVLVKGFDPFASAPELVRKSAGTNIEEEYRRFRLLVRYDTSDWNICGACMTAIADSLPRRRAKASGRTVSAIPAGLLGLQVENEGGDK